MLSKECVRAMCARGVLAGVLAGVLGFLVLAAIGVTEIQRNHGVMDQQAAPRVGK